MSKTFHNLMTNKCESCNRAIIKALPKHITYSLAYAGWVNAAIHLVSNHPGISLMKLRNSARTPLPTIWSIWSAKAKRKLKELPNLCDDQKMKIYYAKGWADQHCHIPMSNIEPQHSKHLHKGWDDVRASTSADYGAMGWDHYYHRYPHWKAKVWIWMN